MRRPEPPLAGVMGWPVAHSLSPRLHSFWLDRAAIAGTYVALPVSPDQLKIAVFALPALGFRGVNITIPHKETVFGLLDRLDPLAKRVAAVNLVSIDERGRLFGQNSDVYGFRAHLLASAPDFQPSTAPAVILGAGGAARAIAVALLDLGVPRLTLVNRNLSRAEALAEALSDDRVEVAGWADRSALLKQAGLLVNATSLGMTGQPVLDIHLSLMLPGGVVFDSVYTPLQTPLLAEAERRGLIPVDGLGMLIHQAVPSFEAFFGVQPQPDATSRAHLVAAL